MAEHEILIGLVVERIKLTGPWSDYAWMPCQVLTSVPETPAWSVIMQNAERVRYYAGEYVIGLHPSSTAQYRENLASGRPSLWVAMRPEGAEPPLEIAGVAVDPSEGESYTETGTSVVETVPMPPEIMAVLAEYIETHHVERVFEKRKRDKSQPRGGRGG